MKLKCYLNKCKLRHKVPLISLLVFTAYSVVVADSSGDAGSILTKRKGAQTPPRSAKSVMLDHC